MLLGRFRHDVPSNLFINDQLISICQINILNRSFLRVFNDLRMYVVTIGSTEYANINLQLLKLLFVIDAALVIIFPAKFSATIKSHPSSSFLCSSRKRVVTFDW